jgi:hypothetical protein
MGRLPSIEQVLTTKVLRLAYRKRWTVQQTATHYHCLTASVRAACDKWKVKLRDEGPEASLQDKLEKLLASYQDVEAAKMAGCSLAWANEIRRRQSIPRPPPLTDPLSGKDEYEAILENESYTEAARDMGVTTATLKRRAYGYADANDIDQPELRDTKSQRAYDRAHSNASTNGSPRWREVCLEVFGHEKTKVAQVSAKRHRDRMVEAGESSMQFPWPLTG